MGVKRLKRTRVVGEETFSSVTLKSPAVCCQFPQKPKYAHSLVFFFPQIQFNSIPHSKCPN